MFEVVGGCVVFGWVVDVVFGSLWMVVGMVYWGWVFFFGVIIGGCFL